MAMTDEREWVRVEVIWDGGVERDADDEAWDWDEGAGVLPPEGLFDRQPEARGIGLSKRRRKKLRGGGRGDEH
jgi:hypothetical protein